MRNFSKWQLIKSYAGKLVHLPAVSKVTGVLKGAYNSAFQFMPTSPQKKLLTQSVMLSVAALVVTSFTPGGTFSASSMSYSNDYISAYALPGDVLVANEDGYLVKVNPQTDEANRVGMTDFAVHTVDSGETLSEIAGRYDVNVNTIMWENGMSSAHTIRIGQKLMIPPVDGINYDVKSGDSLEKIAKKYKIEAAAIIAQNNLETETIGKGQSLFLPGAKPIAPPVVVTASRSGTTRKVSASSSTPSAGKIFIFPTRGKITQGYHAGHYAFDIADRSKPPIWSAASGKVTKVSTGTWGGGYGNHVIVDHGSGLKTLYAHMDTVNVSVGQFVNQGDVLGIMGNTGRVYGATGIHLHWEVFLNGVKQYPGNYY